MATKISKRLDDTKVLSDDQTQSSLECLTSMGFSLIPLKGHTFSKRKKVIKDYADDFKTPIEGFSWKALQETPLEVERCKEVWRNYKGANIGIVTGQVSCLAVADVDEESGNDTIEKIKKQGVKEVFVVFTSRMYVEDSADNEPTGQKMHYYFKTDTTRDNSDTGYPGLNFRINGGYVAAPPSYHYTGSQYTIKVATENGYQTITNKEAAQLWENAETIDHDTFINAIPPQNGVVDDSPYSKRFTDTDSIYNHIQREGRSEDGFEGRDRALFAKISAEIRRSNRSLSEKAYIAIAESINQNTNVPPLPNHKVIEKVRSSLKMDIAKHPDTMLSALPVYTPEDNEPELEVMYGRDLLDKVYTEEDESVPQLIIDKLGPLSRRVFDSYMTEWYSPVPYFGIASLLPTLGAIIGQGRFEQDDKRPIRYFSVVVGAQNVGKSASGSYLREVVQRVFDSTYYEEGEYQSAIQDEVRILGWLKSTAGGRDAFQWCPKLIEIKEEIGDKLMAVTKKGGNFDEMGQFVKEMYDLDHIVAHAAGKKGKEDHTINVAWVAYTLLGTSTPLQWYNALKAYGTTDGLVSRVVTVVSRLSAKPEAKEMNYPDDYTGIPEKNDRGTQLLKFRIDGKLINAVRKKLSSLPVIYNEKGVAEPHLHVIFNKEAKNKIDEIVSRWYDRKVRLNEEGNKEAASAYDRAKEKLKTLAQCIHFIDMDFSKLPLTRTPVQYVEIAEYVMDRSIRQLEKVLTEIGTKPERLTNTEKMVERVYNKIVEVFSKPVNKNKTQIPVSSIRLSVSKAEKDRCLEILHTNGRINVITSKNGKGTMIEILQIKENE